jgi:hypothetical protein
VTERPFSAEVDGDDLVLAFAPQATDLTRRAILLLIDHVEDKLANRVSPRRSRVRERLFPPAYESRARQREYEQRHGAAGRADLLAAARRVLDLLGGQPPVRTPVTEADDWIRVLGVTHLLYTHRDTPLNTDTPRAVLASFFVAAQHDIVVALRPELKEVALK